MITAQTLDRIGGLLSDADDGMASARSALLQARRMAPRGSDICDHITDTLKALDDAEADLFGAEQAVRDWSAADEE